MVKVAVFQHVAHEPLGTFHGLLKDAGYRIRYFNYGREHHAIADMRRYDALVVLGGPMGVYEAERYPHLKDEILCIQSALALGKPVLGICLGSQLLAAALGAKVESSGKKEIGWYDVDLTPEGAKDPILGQLRPTESIFQWHGDTFALPEGAVCLARSALFAHQAFRYGTNAYGLQFHMEVDEPMIERWLKIPENVTELAPLGGAALAERIRAENARRLAALGAGSRRVFKAFIELFGQD